MQYDLIDYQREAAIDCLERLDRGREDWAKRKSLSSFALSAVTGSGKTVIATAVIEALFHGSSDLGTETDPRPCFLWVTDDPALNRQTLNKMLAASDLLQRKRLVILDKDFLDSQLSAGRVYFLNIQKLAKTSGLAHGGNNLREHSMWDVIGNTITSGDIDLYLVLDEAHKGMRPHAERKTIVQRIISGQPGSNPPAPIVWGISATIDRFTTAMKDASAGRTSYPHVEVDLDKVRASGLVKDQILLDEPGEKGTFSSTLLSEAVGSTMDFQTRWKDYADANSGPLVLPVMVVQVPDTPTEATLATIVSTIDSDWDGGLPADAMVHVFGEHETMVIGSRTVKWVPPESIQHDDTIRVVLAKQAISTGWDCPRAEVLYSERPADDATHIAQIIGRMVRQPLAQRIMTDDALNSVACFLPFFNRKALAKITEELTKPGDNAVPDVVTHVELFERNTELAAGVFEFVESLPAVTMPDKLASPLRRAKALAKLLTDDSRGAAMLPTAGEQLAKTTNARLDGLAAEHADAVEAMAEDIRSGKLHQTTMSNIGESLGTSTRTVERKTRDIDRDTRRIVRSVKEGVGLDYFRHRVSKAGDGADTIEVRTEVAAVFSVPEVLAELDKAATKWVQQKFGDHDAEIALTTGSTRDAFLKVREQASEPEVVEIELKTTFRAPTRASNDEGAADLPRFGKHLYADDEGLFPVKLNDWERTVLETELARPGFVAWYRNPPRRSADALRIAYEDEGNWGSLQVDFVVVSERDDGRFTASIVDPHSGHLSDSMPKLRALADYAQDHGSSFARIESIDKASDGALRKLSLHEAAARNAVRSFGGAKPNSLYDDPHVSKPYL